MKTRQLFRTLENLAGNTGVTKSLGRVGLVATAVVLLLTYVFSLRVQAQEGSEPDTPITPEFEAQLRESLRHYSGISLEAGMTDGDLCSGALGDQLCRLEAIFGVEDWECRLLQARADLLFDEARGDACHRVRLARIERLLSRPSEEVRRELKEIVRLYNSLTLTGNNTSSVLSFWTSAREVLDDQPTAEDLITGLREDGSEVSEATVRVFDLELAEPIFQRRRVLVENVNLFDEIMLEVQGDLRDLFAGLDLEVINKEISDLDLSLGELGEDLDLLRSEVQLNRRQLFQLTNEINFLLDESNQAIRDEHTPSVKDVILNLSAGIPVVGGVISYAFYSADNFEKAANIHDGLSFRDNITDIAGLIADGRISSESVLEGPPRTVGEIRDEMNLKIETSRIRNREARKFILQSTPLLLSGESKSLILEDRGALKERFEANYYAILVPLLFELSFGSEEETLGFGQVAGRRGMVSGLEFDNRESNPATGYWGIGPNGHLVYRIEKSLFNVSREVDLATKITGRLAAVRNAVFFYGEDGKLYEVNPRFVGGTYEFDLTDHSEDAVVASPPHGGFQNGFAAVWFESGLMYTESLVGVGQDSHLIVLSRRRNIGQPFGDWTWTTNEWRRPGESDGLAGPVSATYLNTGRLFLAALNEAGHFYQGTIDTSGRLNWNAHSEWGRFAEGAPVVSREDPGSAYWEFFGIGQDDGHLRSYRYLNGNRTGWDWTELAGAGRGPEGGLVSGFDAGAEDEEHLLIRGLDGRGDRWQLVVSFRDEGADARYVWQRRSGDCSGDQNCRLGETDGVEYRSFGLRSTVLDRWATQSELDLFLAYSSWETIYRSMRSRTKRFDLELFHDGFKVYDSFGRADDDLRFVEATLPAPVAEKTHSFTAGDGSVFEGYEDGKWSRLSAGGTVLETFEQHSVASTEFVYLLSDDEYLRIPLLGGTVGVAEAVDVDEQGQPVFGSWIEGPTVENESLEVLSFVHGRSDAVRMELVRHGANDWLHVINGCAYVVDSSSQEGGAWVLRNSALSETLRLNQDGSLDVQENDGTTWVAWDRDSGICSDEPSESFVRGDANGDGRPDISDAVFTLGWLFLGGSAPGCERSANANGDAMVDIADPTFLLNHLFLGGVAPAEPFTSCGPSKLGGEQSLSCAVTACP